MSDLDAIRARHVELVNGANYRTGYCAACLWATKWPCDTAIILAALDAALAREARLNFIIDVANDPHARSCATGVDVGCDCPLSERAALAEPEAA